MIGRAYWATDAQVLLHRAGETQIPSFSFNSLAIRSSPQVRFSAPISRTSCRRIFGRRGLPVGFDFQRQKSRNSLRRPEDKCNRFDIHERITPREHSAQGLPSPTGWNRPPVWLHPEERKLLSPEQVFGCQRGPGGRTGKSGSRARPNKAMHAVMKQCRQKYFGAREI